MSTSNRYSPEFREQTVRMVFEREWQHRSQWATIESVAGQVGCKSETLRKWVRKAERDQGCPVELIADPRKQLKALTRVIRELQRCREILHAAWNFFSLGEARLPTESIVNFIDQHKTRFGVEPICAELSIASSTYYTHRLRRLDPSRRSARSKRDEELEYEIQRVWEENHRVYGVRKVWHQLSREGIVVARRTVARLMRKLGLRGAVRNRQTRPQTAVAGNALESPPDRINRNFYAARPNALWVSDLTYVATLQGFAYVAFVTDAYARRIVGCQVSSSMTTNLTLNALEQALRERGVSAQRTMLVHHSDRGAQYLSSRYIERLKEFGIEPSVGSVGDPYDNALAESIIGVYKTELINRRYWHDVEDVESATLEWVEWFNNHRLLGAIGHVPPSELEKEYHGRKR